MPFASLRTWLAVLALVVVASTDALLATPPSETLLPKSTVGFLSVGNVEQTEARWNETQFGKLMKDPVMKPFAEDLKRQLKEKWAHTHAKLGLTTDDLQGVAGGEASMAMIRPGANQSAFVVLVDVTGHNAEAEELLEKVRRSLGEQNAQRNERKLYGATIETFTHPLEEGQKRADRSVYFLYDNLLCGADHPEIAELILGRFTGKAKTGESLSQLPAFRATMARATEHAGDVVPDIRWFVAPFDYLATMKVAFPPKKREKRKSMVELLRKQGFDAVQGLGGYVNFSVDERYEVVHRTTVYAPAAEGHKPGEKYKLAARMMRYPNGPTLTPHRWVPRELATYASFYWKMGEAFEYANTLIDAFAGVEGVFDDTLLSLLEDPNGPQIDMRRDLVKHLGTRATVVTDYELPITPKCERMVVALETTNEPALAKSIEKIMEHDPDAERREFNGHVIWEMIDAQVNLPKVKIDGGPEFDPFGPDEFDDGGAQGDGDVKKAKIPNSAVCVAKDHLFIASHIDFLKKLLTPMDARKTLGRSLDYQQVSADLNELFPGENSFQVFSRTDEEYRPTYELIRAGRMPEAETFLGRVLNKVLNEGKDEGELREQQIDGRTLPSFETIRRYFGPAGHVVRSEDDGWFIFGVIISK